MLTNKTMKFFFTFFIVSFFFVNTAKAQKQTLFLDKNYNAALQEAKIQKKPIVMMFYATWCAHCNKMKNETFLDSTVVNFYKKAFICVAVDAESSIGTELKSKFQNNFKVRSYPTFAFLDANENLLYCTSGEFKTDAFITEGKNALITENQFLTLKDKFYADVSNSDNCLKYITILRKAGFDATEVTEKYLKTKTDQERFTELNWRIVANGINNFDSDEFKFIIKNKEAFAKVASPVRVEKKIVYLVSETFKNYAEKLDTLNFNKTKSVAKTFQIRKVDSLVFRYEMLLSEQTNNWKEYQKTTLNNVEKFAWKDSNLLTEIISVYLNSIDDKIGLFNAVEWSKQAITISPSLDKYAIITKLLLKNKDYKQALEFANNGKTMATSYGWKAEEIDKLLIDIKKH